MRAPTLVTTLSLFILAACVSAVAQLDEQAPDLNEANYSKIRRAILLNQGLHYWTGPASQAWSAWRKLHGEVLNEAAS